MSTTSSLNIPAPSTPTAAEIAKSAKSAFEQSQLRVNAVQRVKALDVIRAELEAKKNEILAANAEDIRAAKIEVDAERMSESLLKRLDLSKPDKWDSMLQGITDVAALPDPTGIVSYASELDEGLELYRVTCPIGVLLVIFEARPEVLINIAALAIKSGNAAILKGGKESLRTTELLGKAISTALSLTTLPNTYIQTVQTRSEVSALLSLDQYIDLVIPRGSNSLVKSIQNNTRIPVMGHADGICTVYLDEHADEAKAVRVVLDSKTDYPSACNALEILVVHSSLVNTLWPVVGRALLQANVHLLCDPPTLRAISTIPDPPKNIGICIHPTSSDSYTTEHLSLTLSVISVPDLDAAIQFINAHSSHHTDCIVTENEEAASSFCKGVDSAGTFVNASTRFADGFRYGFGTEVGISTGRIHARGPVGLEGLTSYKYVMRSKGDKGHIVGEFGAGKKAFKHAKIVADTVPF